jgi:hypothetical protein
LGSDPSLWGLEEAADRLAGDPETDDAGARIHLGDRVRGDEPAMPREEARSDRECVGNVGKRPVHRTLDLADHPAPVVGDEEARRIDQIQREGGHDSNLFPVCKEKPFRW